jgi:membrane fusion protein, copper/silver efflux system
MKHLILKLVRFTIAKSLVVTLSFSLLLGCNKPKTNEVWYCPMHPDYTSNKFGQCPICNMDLKKKESVKENKEDHSLHQIKQEDKEKTKTDHSLHKQEPTHNHATQTKGVYIAEDKQALIGIKTDKVQKISFKKRIISSGRVAYDPELYNAIIEFREAIKVQRTLGYNPKDNTFSNSGKSRLKQLGLSEEQIREWGYSNKDASVLVTGGTSGVSYIYSQIYESDIGLMKPGLPVEVKVNSYPDRIFHGKVKGIDTILDSKNRTLLIRSEVIDKQNQLKPQMFTEVNIYIDLGMVLVVPKESVMDTGLRKIVYIKMRGSMFVSRVVTVGYSNDEFYEIRDGLSEGDEVVVGANFLLDSESKMKLGNSR